MPNHRRSGPLGTFTIHSPEDYKPRHRGHEHTEACDPGDCEREHYLQSGIFEDEVAS